MERITSRQNPLMAHIRKLNSSRSYRREKGEFTGEGPKLLEEAVKAGAEITVVVVAEGTQISCPAGARQVEVPADLLQSLCDTKTPQGVLFVCRMGQLTPPEQLPGQRYLVLDGLQDPGNVGTLWRTADAFGAHGLFLLPGCADPFSPKTLRATMGACFRLPVWQGELGPLKALLRQAGLPLYATALRADTADLRDTDLTRSAVVIGSEGRGVCPQVLEESDLTIQIPMTARCESLNAAAAGSVILWHMCQTSL